MCLRLWPAPWQCQCDQPPPPPPTPPPPHSTHGDTAVGAILTAGHLSSIITSSSSVPRFFYFDLRRPIFNRKYQKYQKYNIVNNLRTVKSRLVSVWNEILVKQTSVLARPFVFWCLGAAILGAGFLVLNNGRVDTRDIKLTVKRCFPLKWFSSILGVLAPIKMSYIVQFWYLPTVWWYSVATMQEFVHSQ